MVKTRAMKGGCLRGLIKSKKGGCKVGKKRAKGTYPDADFKKAQAKKKGKAKGKVKTHEMPDGTIMSGDKHTRSSKVIGYY